MPVSSVTEHWIKQDALTINLNHFGDPDYLQVSVLAGAVVMAFKQDVIGYNAAHNYRTWPLQAANTYLETSSAVNVYARLTRSEVNASALIVYDPVLRDIEGREISYAEDGSELLGDSDPAFFYVFVGQITESLDSNGNKKPRDWNRPIIYGTLDSSEQKNYAGLLWEMMFTPHFDDPLNPDELTWIEAKKHIGVVGGISMFVNNGKVNLPSIYDGLPIDHDTIYWEVIKDEEGNVIDRVLKAKGGGGGGIESITKQMVIDALGFTPYSAENPNGYITAASIPSALKNPYALTFGSKTYDGSAAKSITASDLGAALSSDLSKYLPLTGGTINASGIPLTINRTGYNVSAITFSVNGTEVGRIGVADDSTPRFLKSTDSTWYNIWHSGNLTKLSQLTDDVVSGKYLPLSGGTVSNATTTPLTVNSTNTEANLQVSVGGSGKALFGYKTGVGVWMRDSKAYNLVIGDDGVLKYGLNNNLNNIWHAGNDGSGSGLDADLLDGKQPDELSVLSSSRLNTTKSTTVGYNLIYNAGFIPQGTGVNGVWNAPTANYTESGVKGEWSGVLRLGMSNTYYNDLFFSMNENPPQWRQIVNGVSKGWRTFAFTDSHVASATSAGSADIATEAKCIVSTKAYNTLTENYNKWQRIAKITLSGQYANGTFSAIFYVGEAMTYQAYATLFKVYLHAYQQKAMGNAPYVKLTWDNSNTYHHIAAIVNYNSSASTIELYAKSDAGYCNMYVKVLGGLNWLNISQTNYTNIPSGTRINPVTEVLAASSAKLTTARTIWGQDFDGTEDVNGVLTFNNLGGTNPTIKWSYGEYFDNRGNFHLAATSGDFNIFNSSGGVLFRVVHSSGNVGIDTPNPAYKLDVNGTALVTELRLRRGLDNAANMRFYSPSSSKDITIENGSGGGNIIFNTNVGGAGIKEVGRFRGDNGSFSLEKSLILNYSTGDGRAFKIGWSNYLTRPAVQMWSYSSSLGFSDMCLGTSNDVTNGILYFRGDTRNWGISTYAPEPSAKLHVNGNVLVGGGLAFYSQRSLKNVVDERGLSLSELSVIKPTRYTWKDGRDNRIHFGGIADDIEKVLPEVIYKTADGTLTMDYGNAGFAIASSLIKPVVDHETKIRMLEIRVKELEEELKRYSA